MGNDQGWLVQGLYDIGHGEGLTGAGYAKQCFKLISFLKAFDQLGNSLRLVAGRCIF